MSNKLIQWPKAVYWDTQFNPVAGCKPCSPACANCYAKALADRFKVSFVPHKTTKQKPPRKGICFCGNFTDLFLDEVVDGQNGLPKSLDIINSTLAKPTEATYLWLTKRVENMEYVLKVFGWQTLSNHYFGFTAENQEWYDKRYSEFKKIPTLFKGWLSAEPLLAPIDLGFEHVYPIEAMPFNWVVVGCESGKNRRPCKIEWIESIVEQCQSHGVPVFVKQIVLPSGKFTNKIDDFPKHLQIRQVPWTSTHGKGN